MKIVFLLILLLPVIAYADFFNERYRGWLWFDQNADNNAKTSNNISPKKARQMIDALAHELENRKNIMIVDPSPGNVLEYLLIEEHMWKQAMKLDLAYRKVKLLHPSLFDKSINPTNVFAVKANRESNQKEVLRRITKLAEKYDLIFYVNSSYPYLKQLQRIIEIFAKKYNFKVRNVGDMHKNTKISKSITHYIKKHTNKDAPIIFLAKRNSTDLLELIRGFTTISELEEYAKTACDYLGI